ncbi:MAG: very short patch repair endonuclease [Flavobacteriales bacterium]|nr:very short patch repair endonuclease [Flavobacteriales bacterium]
MAPAVYVRDRRSPKPKDERTSALMSRIRSRDTGPERVMRRLLSEAGVRGYRLHHAGTEGRPDIAFPGRRVAVFIHGCFWHVCPHCKRYAPKNNARFWSEKLERNRLRDQRKTNCLRVAGWRVVTIWECRLKSYPAAQVGRVLQALSRAESDRRPKSRAKKRFSNVQKKRN